MLFCNEEEAFTFTGKSNLLEAREAMKQYAKHFAITLGKNGAIIFDGDTFIDLESYPVTALDTNGAGDAFVTGSGGSYVVHPSVLPDLPLMYKYLSRTRTKSCMMIDTWCTLIDSCFRSLT